MKRPSEVKSPCPRRKARGSGLGVRDSGLGVRAEEETVIHNFKDLDVWKRSVAFTTDIYRLTAQFPGAERFGLTCQIPRAVVSVPANIAEGWGKGSTREYVQFLMIARGSLMELETHLNVACNLSFLTQDELRTASKATEEIGKMPNGSISALKSRQEAA